MQKTSRGFYWFISFCLVGAAALPDFGVAAGKGRKSAGEDPPFEQLISYYDRVSGGLIRPVTPHPVHGTPPEKLFELDVSGFNHSMDAPDFLAARELFYARLSFDEKKQLHERPYYYHSSWRLLFHPPVQPLELPLSVYDQTVVPWEPEFSDSEYFQPEFQRKLDEISGTELTFGNTVSLLPNGKSFEEKLRLIREAKKYFFGVVMIFFCDDSTQILRDEMIRRKREGVDVRLMVEGLWGKTVASRCLRDLKKEGIPIVYVMDFLKPKSFISVMHHKFWIRDGEEAIIGGQNMHENSNFSTGFNRRTRDTDMLIRSGPSVTELLREYALFWMKNTKKEAQTSMQAYLDEARARMEQERQAGVRGAESYAKWFSRPDLRMKGVCRILVQGNGADQQPIAPVYAELVQAAKHRVLLTSPSLQYSLQGKNSDRWPQKMAALLKERAQSEKIRVDILTNGLEGASGEMAYVFRRIERELQKRDIPLLPSLLESIKIARNKSEARKAWKQLQDMTRIPTIHGWTYFEFIHAKTWFFDRLVTAIGSVNFDDYSMEKSHESTAICMDRHLTAELERQFTQDLVNSVPAVAR